MPSSTNFTAAQNTSTSYKLCCAAQKGDDFAVKSLLAKKVDPNQPYDKVNALCLAVQYDHQNIVKALLDNGANPNQLSPTGVTPLYTAAFYNRENIAAYLIDHGANPNLACANGSRPMIIAAQKKYPAIMALLENKGAKSIKMLALDDITIELERRDIIIPNRVKAIKVLVASQAQEQNKEAFKKSLQEFNELDTFANLLITELAKYDPADNQKRVKNVADLKDKINLAYASFAAGLKMDGIIKTLKSNAATIAAEAQADHVATSFTGMFGKPSRLKAHIDEALEKADHNRIKCSFV